MHQSQALDRHVAYLPAIYLTKSITSLYQQAQEMIAGDQASILFLGESGTGKELLAKTVHYNMSPQAPFFTVNCVNLPFDHYCEQIERYFSFLLGRRASVPAASARCQGTIFFRGVEKLEASVQKSVMHFLQEKLGVSAKHPCSDIQLMFSLDQNGSEPDRQKASEKGSYKIFNPCTLSILPLRERPEDIQPLALFFLDTFSKEYGKQIGSIHSGALQALEAHSWRGNVSELRDVIENAVLLAQNALILREDIRFNISKKSIALESFLSREDFFRLEELEKIYIQTVLRRMKNNKSKAAKILGISRNTLQNKIDLFASHPAKHKTKKRKTGQQQSLF